MVDEGLFVQGPYQGHLSNFGEVVELRNTRDEVVATINTPNEPSLAQQDLIISEIMYHPAGEPQAEYIELLNKGTETLDLTGVKFSEGIEFAFADSGVTQLEGGQRALVVRNREVFERAYGADLPIAGEFANGSALANNGERITIDDGTNSTIQQVRYNDKEPWPIEADGAGSSLAFVGSEWTASIKGGTPGEADAEVSNPDPFIGSPSVTLENVDGSVRVGLSYRQKINVEGLAVAIESSQDLIAWENADAMFELIDATDQGDGTETRRYRSDLQANTPRFVRLRAMAQ